MLKKLRVAVIGCGRISVMHLIPAFTLEEAELVACCDIKPERATAAAEKYGIKAYTDYKEMIAKKILMLFTFVFLIIFIQKLLVTHLNMV